MRAFMSLITIFSVSILPAQSSNLLLNPGFEGDGGWVAYESAGIRETWRSRSGSFNGGLMGAWSGAGMNGMIEQRDIEINPGRTYILSASLWADLGWRPYEQYIKVIFYDEDNQVVAEQLKPIRAIHPMWTDVRLEVTAPEPATTASVCFGAFGVSAYGALTIDDVYFGEEAGVAGTNL